MERRLVAILAADVVGYSRLIRADEEGTLQTLSAYRKVIDSLVAAHRGRIFGSAGDSVIVEFASPVEAVRCAAEIQQEFGKRHADVPGHRRMEFRIGVNLGDVVVEGDDLLGDGVNVAARLQEQADPGGIYVSDDIHRHVEGKIDVSFTDLGDQSLKNIDAPVRVHRVEMLDAGLGGAPAVSENLSLPDKPSIAVLPFDNMSGDAEQEFLADGFTEEIITSLARYRSLSVIARNSSFSYKGKSTDVRFIAKELDTRYVVEGSVRRARERIRVTVQLIDAERGDHIWVEHYDRELNDIFAVQDEIAQTISASVVPEISHVEQERARRKPPQSLSAWECYQRALWHMYQFTLEQIVEAQHLFRRAIELDPEFAAAHSGLAYALLQESNYSVSGDKRGMLDQCLESAQTSTAIDDHDALAHFVLGRIQVQRGEVDIACAEAKKAIELNPSFAYAYLGLGEALMHDYRFEEALTNFKAAARLGRRDPHMWTFFHFQAWPLLALKRYEEAVEAERRALLSPNAGFYPYLPLIAALGHLGRQEDAKEAIERLHELQPGYSCQTMRRQITVSGDFAEQVIGGLRKAGLPE